MGDLGLQKQVAKQFAFLVLEKGYRCVESTPFRVCFVSPLATVEVVFDGNRSYELGLLISRTGSDATFTIDEILRLRGAPEAERFSLIQVTTNEGVASFAEKLADLLRTYGGDFIDGNEASYLALAKQRREEMKTYSTQRDLRVARGKANAAWRAQDYLTFIEVLRPFRTELTPSEIRRLEFAERHQ